MCLTQEEQVEDVLEGVQPSLIWTTALASVRRLARSVAFALAVVALVAFLALGILLEFFPVEVAR